MTTSPFTDLATDLYSLGATTEAVLDLEQTISSIRFYISGRGFVLTPYALDDGQLRIKVEGYECEEVETPEERLEHVLRVIQRTNLD